MRWLVVGALLLAALFAGLLIAIDDPTSTRSASERVDAGALPPGSDGPTRLPSELWYLPIDCLDACAAAVAPDGQTAYVGGPSDDGSWLGALDAETGDIRWSTAAEGASGVAAIEVLGPDLVVTSTVPDGRELARVDPGDGTVRWTAPGELLGVAGTGATATLLASVSAVDAPSDVVGYDLASGERRWRVEGYLAAGGDGCGGLALVWTADDELTAIDTATGDERWRAEVDVRSPTACTAAEAAVVQGGDVVGLAAADGQRRWGSDQTGPELLRYVSGHLLVGDDDGEALLDGGVQRWRARDGWADLETYHRVDPVLIGDDVILVAGTEEQHVVDLRTGATIAEARRRVAGPDALAVGASGVVLATEEGEVVGLALDTLAAQWWIDRSTGASPRLLAIGGGQAFVVDLFGVTAYG